MKKLNTKTDRFNRPQRNYITNEMKSAFRSADLFSSLYPNQQTILQEALLLRYHRLPFDYWVDTVVTEDSEGNKVTTDWYVFREELSIPATGDLKITVQCRILKDKLDKQI